MGAACASGLITLREEPSAAHISLKCNKNVSSGSLSFRYGLSDKTDKQSTYNHFPMY